MQTLQKLRSDLIGTALQAREDRIDENVAAFNKGKAHVEAILESLFALYQKDRSQFEDAVFAEIRTAKVCLGLITRDDLEQLESEQRQKALISAHKAYLKKQRIGHKGARVGFTAKQTHQCVHCQRQADGSIDLECNVCGTVICSCGACGCSKPSAK